MTSPNANPANPFGNLDQYIRSIAESAVEASIDAKTNALNATASDLPARSRELIRQELASMADATRSALIDGSANAARPYTGGISQHFVETTTVKSIRCAMATAKAADRWLVIVSGPAGTGKTFPSLQVSLRTGRPVYPVEISEATTLDDLFMRPWVTGPSTMGWVEGPAVRAAREGGILLLDECDLASPRLIGGLHGLLESGQTRLRSGEWLQAHPDFLVIATCNGLRGSKGSYSTHAISTAFADRAVFVAADYLPEADEVAILSRYGDMDDAKATRNDLVVLRRLFEAGGLRIAPSTRRGAVVVAALAAGATRAEAWQIAMVNGLDEKTAEEVGRQLAAAETARQMAAPINQPTVTIP